MKKSTSLSTSNKLKVSIIYLTALMLMPGLAHSQQRIVVGENTRIQFSKDYNYSFENTVIADPSNPQHLIGSILTMCPDTVRNCMNTLIESNDGGKTWSSEDIPWGANPWCAILPDGEISVSYIYGLNYTLGIKASGKNSGKRQWSSELTIGSGYDHNMLLADNSNGPFNDNLYLISTHSLRAEDHDPFVLIATSKNGGRTFDQRTYHHPFRNVDVNAKTPVVLHDGTLAIPILVRGHYLEGQSKATPLNSFTNWLITSKDGGQTFSVPKLISSNSGDGYHTLLVGRSAQWPRRLYYIFNGTGQKGIFATHSDDDGESWSMALKVDATKNKSQEDIVAAAAINETNGILGLLYLSREDQQTRECYNLYFTASTNGGASFIDPVRVNSQNSCGDKTKGWFMNAWPQGGDYCSLIAKPDGSFLAIWSDARTGTFKLYQSTITIK